jgi:hypothetical protein
MIMDDSIDYDNVMVVYAPCEPRCGTCVRTKMLTPGKSYKILAYRADYAKWVIVRNDAGHTHHYSAKHFFLGSGEHVNGEKAASVAEAYSKST